MLGVLYVIRLTKETERTANRKGEAVVRSATTEDRADDIESNSRDPARCWWASKMTAKRQQTCNK